MTKEQLNRRRFQVKRTSQEKFVRSGWQRFTTYYRQEHVTWLKKLAVKRKMYLVDVIDEMVDEYRKKGDT